MKSYTEGRNLYGTLTKNTSTANLALGDQLANDDYKAICAAKDWPFLQRDRSLTTVANTQSYVLPYDCEQVRTVSTIVANETYVTKMSPSKQHWDKLNEISYKSDYPEWYYVEAGKVYLWPTPSTSSNTISITQKTRVRDLGVIDYTTGNVTDVANGGTTITGNATLWKSYMVGMYIKIDWESDSDTGDNIWYEISSVTSNTELEIVRAYGGQTISSGSVGYTIGQMPLLPEAYHDLPWLYAVGKYWEKEADARGVSFLKSHGNFGQAGVPPTGRIADLVKNYSSENTDMVIDDGTDETYVNPNLNITI